MSAVPKHRLFSPRRVSALAQNTLLELVRLKVFHFLILFAFLVIGSSLFTVKFSFQNPLQVLKDVGLGAISIFSWLLGLLCTANLLPKDQEDRTLYTILAKPVSRFEYLLGKLAGVFLLITLAVLMMSAVFAGVLALREQQEVAVITQNTAPELLPQALSAVRAAAFQANLIPGILLIWLKALLCSTLTLLLSTAASSSVFTMLTSVILYLIGHVQSIAREAWLSGAGEISAPAKVLSAGVALVFPDLQLFNVVDEIAVGTALPLSLFLQSAGFGIFYIVVYFLLAQVVFSSREL
jgi:ABC-type Na+ efflux pump permease subunit